MTRSDLETALYTFFVGFFSMKSLSHIVRWGYDNSNKPALPYCVLHIESANPVGHPEQSIPSDLGIARIFQQWNIGLRVWLHGDNSLFNLMQLFMVPRIPSLVEPLRSSSGLSILTMGNPMDISGLNDQFTEERAVMDIQFSVLDEFTSTLGVDVGLIDTVELTGELKIDDTVVQEITLEINNS